MERTIKRGDIFYADLNPVVGSEQGGTRPVLIISNDIGNRHSPTVIVAAITSRVHTKAKLPVFCQVLFPEKSVEIPCFRQGIFPTFGGH